MDLPAIKRKISLEADRLKKEKRRRDSALDTSQWCITTALCIAVCLQRDFTAAADWLASPHRRGRQLDDGIDREHINAELHRLLDEMPPSAVHLWTDPASSPLQRSCLRTALKWSQEAKLKTHVRTANVEYGAPVRSARLIDEYNAKLHEDSLNRALAPVATVETTKGRQWSCRWRLRHGATIGCLRTKEPVPLLEKRNQAFTGWDCGYKTTQRGGSGRCVNGRPGSPTYRSSQLLENGSPFSPGPIGLSLPDRPAYSLPDRLAYSLPDRLAHSLPDRLAHSLPDRLAYSLPARGLLEAIFGFDFRNQKMRQRRLRARPIL